MTENCLQCRWFRPMTHDPTDGGLCRRNPPTLADNKARVHRGWPKVEPGDFCAEYRPRAKRRRDEEA